MILIITIQKPNAINYLNKIFNTLDDRNIPYKTVSTCNRDIIHRKDVVGLIFPGKRPLYFTTNEPYDYELELYYIFHFPKLPILGMCHGCQFLMMYYGGELITYKSYWPGGKDVELDLSSDRIFHAEERGQNLHFQFHDLPVMTPKATKAGVREIAWLTRFRDGRRHACAFEFEKNRVFGFMFHPEAKKKSRSILYNFYDKVCSGTS